MYNVDPCTSLKKTGQENRSIKIDYIFIGIKQRWIILYQFKTTSNHALWTTDRITNKKKKTQKSLINDNSLVNKKHTVISPNTNTNTIKLRKKIIL